MLCIQAMKRYISTNNSIHHSCTEKAQVNNQLTTFFIFLILSFLLLHVSSYMFHTPIFSFVHQFDQRASYGCCFCLETDWRLSLEGMYFDIATCLHLILVVLDGIVIYPYCLHFAVYMMLHLICLLASAATTIFFVTGLSTVDYWHMLGK